MGRWAVAMSFSHRMSCARLWAQTLRRVARPIVICFGSPRRAEAWLHLRSPAATSAMPPLPREGGRTDGAIMFQAWRLTHAAWRSALWEAGPARPSAKLGRATVDRVLRAWSQPGPASTWLSHRLVSRSSRRFWF